MLRITAIALLLFALLSQSATHLKVAGPPAQQEDGPGGRKLAHAGVTRHRYGAGTREVWIYEPDLPRPRSAPLIIFLHGWSGTNPAIYGAWLDHLVKRGNIVVYPRFQADLFTPLSEFTANAIENVRDALQHLRAESGHVEPELNRVAVVGHSIGGLLAANVAALALESGLPRVRAIMSVEPGRTWNPFRFMNLPLADLKKIPADTLLLTVVGDRDDLAKDIDARRIYYETARVPANNKNYIRLLSDAHGFPQLNADHFAPVAFDETYTNGETYGNRNTPPGRVRQEVTEKMQIPNPQSNSSNTRKPPVPWTAGSAGSGANALDYYGFWKLFDGLCDAAFYGKNREYALGHTAKQRFMGVWSDGVPVREMVVSDKP